MHRLHRGAFGLKLVRDQLTRAAYASFAFWGWFLYGFGPIVPLLRDEQGTSRAVAALHATALAIGTTISAGVSVPLVRRFQRRGTLIGSTILAAAGMVLLVVGPAVEFTLAGALVAGIGGSITLNAVNPVLVDHHGSMGPAVISEANAIAAGCGIFAPLAVGLGVSLGLTWRAAILLSLPLAGLSVVLVRRAPRLPALTAGPHIASALEPGLEAGFVEPATARPAAGPRVPLGLSFWLAAGVIITVVGVEFSTTFWSADLLHTHDGLAKSTASASVSALLVGMTAGRLAAVPLSLRIASAHLLLGAIAVTAAGWFTFWVSSSAVIAVSGLALLGLGLAFTYPLGLVRLMEASRGRPDTANAVSSLGVGLASGGAPFALGAVADHIGTHRGFFLVPILLAISGVLLVASMVSSRGPGSALTSTPTPSPTSR